MPKCPNCFTYLPSEFFGNHNKLDPRCEFCIRGTHTIHYGTFGEKSYTKGQAEKDYELFIRKMKERPNIKNIIEVTRKKEEDSEEEFVNITNK